VKEIFLGMEGERKALDNTRALKLKGYIESYLMDMKTLK
jgi:hypothetical protein